MPALSFARDCHCTFCADDFILDMYCESDEILLDDSKNVQKDGGCDDEKNVL